MTIGRQIFLRLNVSVGLRHFSLVANREENFKHFIDEISESTYGNFVLTKR